VKPLIPALLLLASGCAPRVIEVRYVCPNDTIRIVGGCVGIGAGGCGHEPQTKLDVSGTTRTWFDGCNTYTCNGDVCTMTTMYCSSGLLDTFSHIGVNGVAK
jgi:hypothetical protein